MEVADDDRTGKGTPMSDDQADRIAKLERELAELKAQVKPPPAAPYKPEKPWPKYDPTEGFRLPASAVKAMCDVVPDFRGIAQEQKQGVGSPGGFLGPELKAEKKEPPRAVEIPLEPPSGIRYVDQIAEHFDRLDRLQTAKQIADAIKAGGGK
jgi:hypothetical protein